MKPKILVAITLVIFGIGTFIYQGVTVMTAKRDESGWMRMTTERSYSIPLLPIFGTLALIGGLAMLLVDKNDFKPLLR